MIFTASNASLSAADAERLRLEREIADMEAAIARAQNADAQSVVSSTSRVRKKKVVKRFVRKAHQQRLPRSIDTTSLTPADASPASKAEADAASAARRKLEQEIAAMEAAIAEERQRKIASVMAETTVEQEPALTEEERQRRQLEAEIAAMEAAISKERLSKSQRRRAPPPVQPVIVEETESDAFAPVPTGPPRPAFLASIASAAKQHRSHTLAEPIQKVEATAPARPSLLAGISAAVEDRAERVAKAPPSEPTPPPLRPALPGFLASIAGAAEARDQRVEAGEMIKQDIAPEVAERQRSAPQLSTSMAEMITKRAMEREKRLEAGGEKKMTVVKEKAEYKAEFNNICLEAAQLGRLTRLNEHVIEAVAVEKTPEEEWRSAGLMAIQWRSSHMSVIHEAARVGAETKLPERIVSNAPELAQDWDYEEEDALSPRMAQLLELNTHAGAGGHKIDRLILGRKEEREPDHLLVKPMVFYSNIDEVVLPKAAPPKIDPKKAAERLSKPDEFGRRPMIDIGNEVATLAWERRSRLDRPNQLPKIKEKCNCPYCDSASPYQTFAYKMKEKKRRETGYETPPEEYDERRRERERKKAERMAHLEAQRAPVVESEYVGMSVARERFAPKPKAEPQADESAVVPAAAMENGATEVSEDAGPRAKVGRLTRVRKVRPRQRRPAVPPPPPVAAAVDEQPALPLAEEPQPMAEQESLVGAPPVESHQDSMPAVSHIPEALAQGPPSGLTSPSVADDDASLISGGVSVSESVISANGTRRVRRVRKVRRKPKSHSELSAPPASPTLPAPIPEVVEEPAESAPVRPVRKPRPTASPAPAPVETTTTTSTRVVRNPPKAAAPVEKKKKKGIFGGLFSKKK